MIAPLIAMPGGAEWLIILAIVILVFGAAKLPELARGSGQALRIFKAETKGLRDDDDDDKKDALPPTTVQQPVQQPEVTPTPVQQPTEVAPQAQVDPADNKPLG